MQLEIITVIESLNQLRESPEYELCQLSEQKSGVLDELAAERTKLLETESSELEKQADRSRQRNQGIERRGVISDWLVPDLI